MQINPPLLKGEWCRKLISKKERISETVFSFFEKEPPRSSFALFVGGVILR